MITKKQAMYILDVADETQFDNLLLLTGDCIFAEKGDYTDVLKNWIKGYAESNDQLNKRYSKLKEDFCLLKEGMNYLLNLKEKQNDHNIR